MRIAFVIAFFTPVRKVLQGRYSVQVGNRSLIWIGQAANGQADIRQFKSDFLDQVAQGATDFLICTPTNRRDLYAIPAMQGVADAAKLRNPDVTYKIAQFASPFESEPLCLKLDEFQVTREMQFSAIRGDVETWVTTTHAERLVMHPRAARGLRKSFFQDVPLIYASIDLLAREYRDTRLAPPEQSFAKQSSLDARLLSLGLELAPSISESRAGEEGFDYFVDFPPAGGRRFLEQHIKKGVAHDERVCLRIYFFWSALQRKVVVGWLTSHLGTRNG